MDIIILDQVAVDGFPVLDADSTRITGLVNGDFTKLLYNPSGSEVSGSIPVTVSELTNGNYKIEFTPNVEGTWIVEIANATYFLDGKRQSYLCTNIEANIRGGSDTLATLSAQLDSIYTDTTGLLAAIASMQLLVERSLGLSQENFKISGVVRDANGRPTSLTMTIYNDNTFAVVKATYTQTNTWDATGLLTSEVKLV